MRSAWFGLVSVVALGGCYVHARSEPAYVETTSAPVEYDTYPATYYEGHTVFYVGGRWGWQDGGRWHYYDREPVELRHHRETYVRRAPVRHDSREERRLERRDERREIDRR
jgi:hypothetical protein